MACLKYGKVIHFDDGLGNEYILCKLHGVYMLRTIEGKALGFGNEYHNLVKRLAGQLALDNLNVQMVLVGEPE